MGEAAVSEEKDGAGAEPTRKWRVFSAATVSVLGLSILAVLAAVVFFASEKMGNFARMEHRRKAEDLSRFIARIAFVPMSLENVPLLERIADAYVADPDVVRIELTDASGKNLVARTIRALPEARLLVEASQPIVPTEGLRKTTKSQEPIGRVTVTMSADRIHKVVSNFIRSIAAISAILLAASVLTDLALISWMTHRLKKLVGEARLNEELRRSNKELNEFAYVASHDLQEPLRKITNFVQLLQRKQAGRLDADSERFMGYIVDATTRMTALIRDLLDYSRIGQAELVMGPTDMNEVLQQVLSDIEMALDSAKAEVVQDPLPVITANRAQMGRLLQNLISNAVKFRRDEPPKVKISATRAGHNWEFHVADNGIGIEAQYGDRIFGIFQRLHTRTEYAGTGIGLAVCKKIVERHKGTIWMDSTVGKGTTFHFNIPS
ncbi:MAG: PAS domain-containing sensor histidine kinase [Elusimicrobia bacterium]|nr:PAS domain-containing sensor histidine kinase [Elusimicrobiota bacterium]